MQKQTRWVERPLALLAAAFHGFASLLPSHPEPVGGVHLARPGWSVAAGVVYISLVGLLDLSTPRGMNFEFLYLAGCAVLGWSAGARQSLLIAFASSVFVFLDEYQLGHSSVAAWIMAWNVVVRFVAFAATGWLAAEVGRLTRHLEQTVHERTARLRSEVEEHKQTAARWHEAMQLFKQVTENITEVFWVTDPARTRIQYVSPEYERLWGHSRQSLYARPESWLEAIDSRDRQRVVAAIQSKIADGGYDEQYRVRQADGSTRWVHDRAFPIRNPQSQLYRIVGLTEDITQQKAADAARFALERQILEISDREQARIGHDVHDGLCQQLIGTALTANLLHKELQAQERSEASTAQRLCVLVDEAITESRRIARGLYPVRLSAEGLVPALIELSGAMAERFRTQCECHSNLERVACDLTTATHLYRIAQEALQNAVKHSGGTCFSIQLEATQSSIELAVKDNGRGFCDSGERRMGMGLHIMDYRARSMGGTLRLESSTKGTVVTCVIPSKPSS